MHSTGAVFVNENCSGAQFGVMRFETNFGGTCLWV